MFASVAYVATSSKKDKKRYCARKQTRTKDTQGKNK